MRGLFIDIGGRCHTVQSTGIFVDTIQRQNSSNRIWPPSLRSMSSKALSASLTLNTRPANRLVSCTWKEKLTWKTKRALTQSGASADKLAKIDAAIVAGINVVKDHKQFVVKEYVRQKLFELLFLHPSAHHNHRISGWTNWHTRLYAGIWPHLRVTIATSGFTAGSSMSTSTAKIRHPQHLKGHNKRENELVCSHERWFIVADLPVRLLYNHFVNLGKGYFVISIKVQFPPCFV